MNPIVAIIVGAFLMSGGIGVLLAARGPGPASPKEWFWVGFGQGWGICGLVIGAPLLTLGVILFLL